MSLDSELDRRSSRERSISSLWTALDHRCHQRGDREDRSGWLGNQRAAGPARTAAELALPDEEVLAIDVAIAVRVAAVRRGGSVGSRERCLPDQEVFSVNVTVFVKVRGEDLGGKEIKEDNPIGRVVYLHDEGALAAFRLQPRTVGRIVKHTDE